MSQDQIIKETQCIFQQPWWLEAVAPGSWDEVKLINKGKTQARLPYIKQKKIGLTLLMMPPFTQVLGPWLEPLQGKYATRLSRQKQMMTDLIEQLPRFDYFKQNFHYSFDNWLPFYWKDFEQTTRYTYVLDDISDMDAVWSGIKGNIRREIRKARKQITVETDLGVEKLWNMHLKTFERQNETPDFSFETFKRLDDACKKHDARKAFFAIDEDGHMHAALYIVWDENSAYYLVGGADPKLRNSGASSLLMWEAINYVSERTQKFDFEGSMIESIERFFRGFGARQKPYFRITKMSKKMQLLMNTRDMFKTLIK